MSNTTYYQRNRDMMLNRAKDFLKMIKKDINTETYLKKKKAKRENM